MSDDITGEPPFRKPQFEVHIEPNHRTRQDEPEADWSTRTVYDITVKDSANGNVLVFSNQGYENRQFAVDLAIKLFRGRPAVLYVWNAEMTLDEVFDL